MKKKIAILGSTGSIGKTLLKIIKKDKKNFDIILLTAEKNYEEILKQAKIEHLKYLWGIKTPDSQREDQISSEFPLIDDFKQCFPNQTIGF